MVKKILSVLGLDGKKRWNTHDFASFAARSDVPAKSFFYPDELNFEGYFWDRLKEMYRYTLGDGHERETSVFSVDSDILLTDIFRGKESYVKTNHKVSVKYKVKDKSWATKYIMVDAKPARKISVKVSNLPKTSAEILVKYLFNIHTHPPHSDGVDTVRYSFFSGTDIDSFLKSSSLFTGLVTDKFWLLAKTDESPKVFSGNTKRAMTEKELLGDYRFVIYCGDLGGRLVKKGFLRV